jgi:hypothetical protein
MRLIFRYIDWAWLMVSGALSMAKAVAVVTAIVSRDFVYNFRFFECCAHSLL